MPNRHRRRRRNSKMSCRVASAVWTHTSAVVTQTQFTIFCAVELLRLVTRLDIMTTLLKKIINIDQNSRSQTAMKSIWSISKLSTESVGGRRELVANSIHTADANVTWLDSWVASAVWFGHNAKQAYQRFKITLQSQYDACCQRQKVLENRYVFIKVRNNAEVGNDEK